MIGIQLEGDSDYLDLPDDVTIRLRLENPILGDGEKISPGSYSYPFTLPIGERSPRNTEKLRHPDVVENADVYEKKMATLSYGGVPFRAGVLKPGEIPEADVLETSFAFGLSQISPDFKTADLRDVLSEAVVIDDTPITKKLFLKRRDTDDWQVEINGKKYEGSVGDIITAVNVAASASLDSGNHVPYATLINAGTTPLGGFGAPYLELKLVTYNTVGGVPTYADSGDPLQELHLQPVDDRMNYWCEAFDMDGYYDGFDTFFDGYITGAYPDDRFRIPLRLNGAKYKDAADVVNMEYVNMINVATGGDGLLRNDPNIFLQFDINTFTVTNSNSVQPFVLLKWVLDKIADYFGFSYEGTFYTDPKMAEIQLDNTAALDVPQFFMGDKKFVFWRREFNMNELVPNWKVVQFFGALQSRWNLTIYYNEVTKKVTMNKREDITLSYDFIDITRMSSPKQGQTSEEVTGIKLRVPKDEKDLASNEESYSTGTAEKELVVECGRLHVMKTTYFGNLGRQLIRVLQPFGEEFSLRIFNYRGIVSTAPYDHPWAHIHGIGNDTYDIERIYNTHWKYWLRTMAARKIIKIKAELPFRMLRAIEWEKKYRYDRSNYMIKSIDVELSNEKVGVSDVELYSMR